MDTSRKSAKQCLRFHAGQYNYGTHFHSQSFHLQQCPVIIPRHLRQPRSLAKSSVAGMAAANAPVASATARATIESFILLAGVASVVVFGCCREGAGILSRCYTSRFECVDG